MHAPQTSIGVAPIPIKGSGGAAATGVFSRFRLVGAGIITCDVAVAVAVIVGEGVAVNVGVAVFVGVEDGSTVSVGTGETKAEAVEVGEDTTRDGCGVTAGSSPDPIGRLETMSDTNKAKIIFEACF